MIAAQGNTASRGVHEQGKPVSSWFHDGTHLNEVGNGGLYTST